MKKMICWCYLLLVAGILCSNFVGANAEEPVINEDELFNAGETVEDPNNVISEEADQELKKQHIGVSGAINTTGAYTRSEPKQSLIGSLNEDEDFEYYLSADLFFDFRFKGGVKSFVSLGTEMYPEGESARSNDKEYYDFLLKECFLDANWKDRVYFRLGKQVLKWGKSYYWNSTDLINVDMKDFYDLDYNREGTTGLKIHIPSGVKHNIYFFVGTEDAGELEDMSFSGKYEWLAGNSEMSLSAWYKDGYHPVFGYDISGRIGKVDWCGEISVSNGKDKKVEQQLEFIPAKGWYPQVSLGFTQYFDHGSINDRIRLTGEFFYNAAGYTENIYQLINKETDERMKWLYLSYYQPFRNSKYYVALFGTVNKFLIPELTLNINSIANLVDKSIVLCTGVTYKPTLKNLYIDLTINNYFGDTFTEATLLGNEYQINLGIQFLF